MFSSLRGKFLAVSLGALCVLGLAMGIAGTQMLLQVSEKREVESIHRTAEVYRSELDLALVRVEDTAGFAATHLRGRAERGDAPDAWQAGQDNSLRLVQETFAGMPAVRAYDVCTIAADGTVHGHAFTRPSADDAFVEQTVTPGDDRSASARAPHRAHGARADIYVSGRGKNIHNLAWLRRRARGRHIAPRPRASRRRRALRDEEQGEERLPSLRGRTGKKHAARLQPARPQ